MGQANVGAALWRSTAESVISLHPAGSDYSAAIGVHAGVQVGFARIGGRARAGLWRGTASSWVNLHPTGATESIATAVHGGQQAGWGTGWFSPRPQAGVWNGSAASFRSLHPAWASESGVWTVHSGQQAGYVTVNGLQRATLWYGTTASLVNLHAFLPSRFSWSVARGVWSDQTLTRVVGYGNVAGTNRWEAIMWVGPPPPKPAARP